MSDARITVSGDGQFYASLDALAQRASTVVGRVAPKLQQVFAGHVFEQFNTEGGRTGEHWELSEAYAASKARTHPGKPAMQKEGKLLASLTDINAEGAIYEPQPDSVAFGSSLSYAMYQFNAGHDLLGVSREDEAEYLEIIADDLTDYARGLGFKP